MVIKQRRFSMPLLSCISEVMVKSEKLSSGVVSQLVIELRCNRDISMLESDSNQFVNFCELVLTPGLRGSKKTG